MKNLPHAMWPFNYEGKGVRPINRPKKLGLRLRKETVVDSTTKQ